MKTKSSLYVHLGEHLKVRGRRKRKGPRAFDWVIERTNGGVLDAYPSRAQASFIAWYCEEHHEGSYGSEARHAARAAWDELPE